MTTERREYGRVYLQALVRTRFGTYFIKDVSPGGACVIGPSELKEKLNINEVIELDICTTHGNLLLRPISMHCRGEVIRIRDPNPYVTEVAIRFHELPTLRFEGGQDIQSNRHVGG